MPSLSLRSFAELIHLPAYEQTRILHEQKFPKQSPQVFRLPFYQASITAIRRHYRSGRTPAVLTDARTTARQLRPAARATHNLRVLAAFANSDQLNRPLAPTVLIKHSLLVDHGVELRLSFDLCASEGNRPYAIFYNTRDAPVEPSIAQTTVELARWALDDLGAGHAATVVQLVDLKSGTIFSAKSTKKTTLRRASENAKIIATLWPTI